MYGYRQWNDAAAAAHQVVFNVALLNRYDHGQQSLGYHADR